MRNGGPSRRRRQRRFNWVPDFVVMPPVNFMEPIVDPPFRKRQIYLRKPIKYFKLSVARHDLVVISALQQIDAEFVDAID